MASAADWDIIRKELDRLSPQSLAELRTFIAYLQYKEQHPNEGRQWFEKVYDLFAPVRQAVSESGMTEGEIDQIIDDAIAEVRLERKT